MFSVTEEELEKAVQYTSDVISRWITKGRINIPARHPGVAQLDDLLQPIIRQRPPEEVQSGGETTFIAGYTTSTMNAVLIREAMAGDEEVATRVGIMVMRQLRSGEPLSVQMYQLACAAIEGRKNIKKRVGRKDLTDRNFLICGLVDNLYSRFGLQRAWSKGSSKGSTTPVKLCGVTVVAATISAFGQPFVIGPDGVFQIFNRPASHRELAKGLPHLFAPTHELELKRVLHAVLMAYDNDANSASKVAFAKLKPYLKN